MTSKTLNASPPNRELSTKKITGLISLAALLSLVLLAMPLLGYPFRLLMTIVHELGHGLTAVLTGGEFIRFVVYPNGAGLAFTQGGWRFLVIPAGYLSVALFGAGLILLGRSAKWSRLILALIGALMIYFALRYGGPTLLSGEVFAGALTIISGVVFGVLILLVAVKSPPGGIVFLLHLLAFQAALTAFSDLIGLIGLSTRVFNAPENDALSMAQLTYIPAMVWAIVWAAAALILIGGAVWFTWVRPAIKSLSTR